MSINQKLEQLREQWKTQPHNRATIELKVKVLKLGKEYPEYVESENPFINNVKKALI